VSVRRLMKRNQLPKARGPWALDSAGFSELSIHGEWTIPVKTYVEEVRRYIACIGNLQWASIRDWMTEPVIRKKTGLTVEEHQQRTLDSYQELLALAPEVPWAPVLQGWTVVEFWEHANQYQKAGINLANAPVVGVGSVCRRQSTLRAGAIFATLQDVGAKLHGFGLKTKGLPSCADFLWSADSLAWSFRARRSPPLEGCDHEHCNNCLKFALRWRKKVLDLLGIVEPPREEPLEQRRLF